MLVLIKIVRKLKRKKKIMEIRIRRITTMMNTAEDSGNCGDRVALANA
jgi:hypothetical protein